MELEPARARSPIHEARWLNLLGFCLRPGYGYAVDDWRTAQTWRLSEKKVAHPKNELCRAEWWILWRRIAGGLTAGQQRALAAPLLAEIRKDTTAGWGSHETGGNPAAARFARMARRPGETRPRRAAARFVERGRRGRAATRAGVDARAARRARAALRSAQHARTRRGRGNVDRAAGEAARAGRGGGVRAGADWPAARATDSGMYRTRRVTRRWVGWNDTARRGTFVDLVRAGGELRAEERSEAFGESLPYGLELRG